MKKGGDRNEGCGNQRRQGGGAASRAALRSGAARLMGKGVETRDVGTASLVVCVFGVRGGGAGRGGP